MAQAGENPQDGDSRGASEAEAINVLDGESSGRLVRPKIHPVLLQVGVIFKRSLAVLWIAVLLAALVHHGATEAPGLSPPNAISTTDTLSGTAIPLGWSAYFNPRDLIIILLLLGCAAFFSACEVAFFSLHRLHLRGMREGGASERLVARLMEHPGRLLTSILMGSSIVNVLLSVLMALPVERFFSEALQMPPVLSYILSVAVCTGILLFFGEIFPKALVLRQSMGFAKTVSPLIFVLDLLMTPVRNAIIFFTGILFKVTRFSEVRPAPFMTDEEFFTLLTESEASGVIEKDEREMIQGILELSDVMVREILVPRPDMIALKSGSTIGEALEVFREHEYSRIPVYAEDLDHIVGVLNAKDMLSFIVELALDKPIDPLLHPAHFVPETMTVANFVKMAQHTRSHIAVVVDEYGGTEGVVTLQDALREVVGNVGDDEDEIRPSIKELREDLYLIDGSLPLDELEVLTGRNVDDEEHTTVAGFIMDHTDKIPETGDVLVHDGVKYVVEEVQGKRISRLRVEVMHATKAEEGAS